VIPGLVRPVREHRPPLRAGAHVPDPPALGGEAEQHLRHRQRQQLAVGQLRSSAASSPGRHHMIVDQHVQCGQEGVQFFRHTLILNTLRPLLASRRADAIFKESTI
jgi:hypothetical protein